MLTRYRVKTWHPSMDHGQPTKSEREPVWHTTCRLTYADSSAEISCRRRAINETLTSVRDAMNKVTLVRRWRGWFGLFLFVPVAGIAQQSIAQLAGQFQSAPGTTA